MKVFLFIPICFFSTVLYSQNITLNDLFSFCNKANWDEVNEIILKKGWEYHESAKGDDTHYNTITWSFKKERYGEKAQGWFKLFTYEGLPNKVSLSFFNKPAYNQIKNAVTASGMKSMGNEIDDNKITANYANDKFIVTIQTAKRENESENDYGMSQSNSLTAYNIIVVKKEGVFDNDNGLKKSYDNDGNMVSEFTLKAAKLEGIGKSFYPNGKPKVISNFIKGKKQGGSREYDDDGNLTAEYTYVSDELNGPYKIYENGKLKISGSILNGKKNGNFKLFNEDGLLYKEYQMKQDSLQGPYVVYYYSDGKIVLKETGQYVNDQKEGLWQFTKFIMDKPNNVGFYNYYDGSLNGFFKEVSHDSIIFGSYKNGELSDQYSVYRSLFCLIGGQITGDTAMSVLYTTGSYYNGIKNGYWKYYSLTKALIAEGRYLNDKKEGEWKFYHDTYETGYGQDSTEHYSKQLFLIENYKDGEKDGRSIQYSSLDRQAIPCDTIKNKNANPLDTCNRLIYNKFYYSLFYKKGQLHGPIEYKDSLGVLKYKGTFVNGEKQGFWIEGYYQTPDSEKPYYFYQTGNYTAGRRDGEWNEYVNKDFIYTTYNYQNGKLNGKTTDYNSIHKPREERYFENDNFKKLVCFDSTGLKITRTFDILKESGNEIKCLKTEFFTDGKLTEEYTLAKNDDEKINPRLFELIFFLKTDTLISKDMGYLDGEIKVYNFENKIDVEGKKYKQSKVGNWKFYFYDLNIYQLIEYSGNIAVSEKYYMINSDQLFTGKFIEKHKNGNEKYEFNISEGLRDGKSRYYDETGKLIKTEKYSKGTFVN